MIEQTAVVTSNDGLMARVETRRTSACGGCQARPVCGTSALARLFGARQNQIMARNELGARPGDSVIIGLDESALTRSSFACYIVPLLSLILFALLGQWLGQATHLAATEPASLSGGLLGLVIGLLWVRRYAQSISRDKRYQAVIVRLAGKAKVEIGR